MDVKFLDGSVFKIRIQTNFGFTHIPTCTQLLVLQINFFLEITRMSKILHQTGKKIIQLLRSYTPEWITSRHFQMQSHCQVVDTRLCVTKQYYLVLAKGWRRPVAWQVIVGLVKSNVSLL